MLPKKTIQFSLILSKLFFSRYFRGAFQCGALADSDNESEEKGNPCVRMQSEKMRIPYQNTKYCDDEKKNFFTVENNLQVDKVNQCNRMIVNTSDKNKGSNINNKKNFENIFSRRSSASTAPTTGTYVLAFLCTYMRTCILIILNVP